MNILEKIWVDLILNIKDPDYKSMWKFYTLFIMTVLLSLNMVTILVLLPFDMPRININIFPGKMIDGAIEFFVMYGIPCFLINYFMIFHKKRYQILKKCHKNYKGRLFVLYMISSFVIIAIPIFAHCLKYGIKFQ